jgi:hypothetical protein
MGVEEPNVGNANPVYVSCHRRSTVPASWVGGSLYGTKVAFMRFLATSHAGFVAPNLEEAPLPSSGHVRVSDVLSTRSTEGVR